MTPPEGLEPLLPSNADVVASNQKIANARRLAAVEEKRVVDSRLPPKSSKARMEASKVEEEESNGNKDGAEDVKSSS